MFGGSVTLSVVRSKPYLAFLNVTGLICAHSEKMLHFRSKRFLKTAFQLHTGAVPRTFIHQVAWDASRVLNSSWKTWTTSIHLSGSESCQIPSVLASVLQKQLRQWNVWQCLSSLLAAKQLHVKIHAQIDDLLWSRLQAQTDLSINILEGII